MGCQIRGIFLENPPATQNAPGEKDGRGPATGTLGCLRVTDPAQVAGLLWPTELIFAGTNPATYAWAEDLYKWLGGPGRATRVADLGNWKPG